MKTIASIMFVSLMMLLTAMAVNAEEHASEAVTAAVTVAEEKVNETATKEAKEQPGFEGIFAIAGLLAVACLVLSKRE